jgi:hypothetical protein
MANPLPEKRVRKQATLIGEAKRPITRKPIQGEPAIKNADTTRDDVGKIRMAAGAVRAANEICTIQPPAPKE